MLRPIDSLPLFYAHALAIEHEATERLIEFEGYFVDHGEEVLAGLCHQISHEELEQFRFLERACRGLALPPIATGAHGWLDLGNPEDAAHELFYRVVNARQLLDVALTGERKAERFYRWVARTSRDGGVRALAKAMAREERAHERCIDEALAYRPPAPDWESLLAQGIGPGVVAPD